MAGKGISQPQWVANLPSLQKSIYSIIAKADVDPTHINPLLNEEALSNYWVPAFTHSSVDATNNYEKLEFYGDKVLNYAFASYIRQRFENKLDQEKATLLLNRYMSKKFQAELSRKLGLIELVRHDPDAPNVGIDIQEDIFESFFGAFTTLADDKIQPGLGYIYSFNLLSDIFNNIAIELSEVQKDPITQLKELFEKLQWGKPISQISPSDDLSKGEIKVEVRSITGETIGVGYGSQKAAEFQSAENALGYLSQRGITLQYAEEEKLKRTRGQNVEFDRQYKRVEAAVAKLNEQATAGGIVRIERFKITNVESRRVRGGSRYTFAIDIAYDSGQGRLVWRSVHQLTGDNPDQTKIDLMKTFADNYRIPVDI